MAKENSKPDSVVDSPFGRIGIWVSDSDLCRLELVSKKYKLSPSLNPVAKNVVKQLKEYFSDRRVRFDLSLSEQGTPFQKSVWRLLRKIPVGQTVYYKDLARKLNTSPRAIGSACRSNPIQIVTPCHRVVAMNDLGGYMGETSGAPVRMKQWLIDHERGL